VEFTSSLDDLVLFEVPGHARGQELLAELSPKRLAWMESGSEVAVVGVLLGPSDDDLASLLRTVERWVSRCELLAIRFEVDGVMYVLQPTFAAGANTAA
jgi:hypothetical protein